MPCVWLEIYVIPIEISYITSQCRLPPVSPIAPLLTMSRDSLSTAKLSKEKVCHYCLSSVYHQTSISGIHCDAFKGNIAFKDKDYVTARLLYSYAMEIDPSEYVYPLNRALTNLKLKRYVRM